VKTDWRGAVIPLALLLAAQIVCQIVDLRSDSLASPATIIAQGWAGLLDGTVLLATGQTLAAALGGLALGCLFGLAAGALLGLFPLLDRLGVVSLEIIRPIPSVALIPVAMLVFGFGYRMEIALVAFSTLWPMLILTRAAVAGVEPRLLEVAQALKLGTWAKIRKILIPAILPRVLVALRLSTGIALIVAVTVEIAANPMGLGYGMMLAQQSLKPGLMFALLFWIGLIGWLLNLLTLKLLGRWAYTERVAKSGAVPEQGRAARQEGGT